LEQIMRRTLMLVFFLSVGGLSCGRTPATTPDVVTVPLAALPGDPADPAWDDAPEHVAKLLLQDLVEPRLMKASTPEVRVRALTDGSSVAFRLTWADPDQNDLPTTGRMMDACAVQVPETLEATAPDPQMGMMGRRVEITYWRADWQASVNGRADSIKEIYPNASVDHYPFEAASLEPGSDAQRQMAMRYAPAEAVGNRRAGPRATPVEDLIAEGPGTLSPAPTQGSKGRGTRTGEGWSVVLIRRMPVGLSPTTRSQVAFAVWQGSAGEAGARKMRTGWVPLTLRGTS
jgi:hypothetical protein